MLKMIKLPEKTYQNNEWNGHVTKLHQPGQRAETAMVLQPREHFHNPDAGMYTRLAKGCHT